MFKHWMAQGTEFSHRDLFGEIWTISFHGEYERPAGMQDNPTIGASYFRRATTDYCGAIFKLRRVLQMGAIWKANQFYQWSPSGY